MYFVKFRTVYPVSVYVEERNCNETHLDMFNIVWQVFPRGYCMFEQDLGRDRLHRVVKKKDLQDLGRHTFKRLLVGVCYLMVQNLFLQENLSR